MPNGDKYDYISLNIHFIEVLHIDKIFMTFGKRTKGIRLEMQNAVNGLLCQINLPTTWTLTFRSSLASSIDLILD